MAYCEREDCIHHKACYEVNGLPCRNDFAHYYSKADVVPKSEVEKLERTVKYLEGVCEFLPDKVKAEVAREIFEEIDGWFMYCENYSGHLIKIKLSELKKKYINE